MGLFSSLFSVRAKAESRYRRGIKKADQRDLAGAIADYTAVMAMSKVPADVRAMALLNRALAHSSSRNFDQAEADLKNVLAVTNVPEKIRSTATEKLKRLNERMARA